MVNILLIDHYDSFTETIKSYFEVLKAEVTLVRFDDERLKRLETFSPTHIVLSPGPGAPHQVKPTIELIEAYHQHYPMLGICLGHQCMIDAFGGKVMQAKHVVHGKCSAIAHKQKGLFDGLNSPFTAARYHSLIGDMQSLPECLIPTAWTEDQGEQVLMGVQHRTLPIYGIQFHPEAILSHFGANLFSSFIQTNVYTNIK